MTGKQNFIFFLGLTLIFINYWAGGQFKIVSQTIFATAGAPIYSNPPTSSGNSGNSGQAMPHILALGA